MNAGCGRICSVVLFLGAVVLCGCATPRSAANPVEPDPTSVRLPIITPMKIDQRADPPAMEPTITPVDIEEGKARSLKMFQIDYERGKAGPPVGEDAPSPPDAETNR